LTQKQEINAVCLGVGGIVEFSSDLAKDLLRAIYSVAQGKFWVRRDVLNEYVRCTQRSPRASNGSLEQHTVRQEQIISLIGEGLSNKEIADIIGISERTVKFHVSNLLQKYQVDNRRKLLVKTALPSSA
jgi:two-component system nitrate/nitrite response regulator NarP